MTWQTSATLIICLGWLLHYAIEWYDSQPRPYNVGCGHWEYDDWVDDDDEWRYGYTITVDWDWPSVNGWSMDHPTPLRALS